MSVKWQLLVKVNITFRLLPEFGVSSIGITEHTRNPIDSSSRAPGFFPAGLPNVDFLIFNLKGLQRVVPLAPNQIPRSIGICRILLAASDCY